MVLNKIVCKFLSLFNCLSQKIVVKEKKKNKDTGEEPRQIIHLKA